MKNILIIEDDVDIQELLEIHLSDEGYHVEVAADGIVGMDLFLNNNYDLILLDLLLPKLNGYKVCEFIRQRSEIPIIMLTALESEDSEIKGLDLRADDYITKPFSFPILKRRISNLIQRNERSITSERLNYGELSLDLEGYKAYIKDKDCELTPKEFELLRELMQGKGKVFTRQMLLDSVWGYDYFGSDRIVDTHIKNIRKKTDSDIVKTIKGVGYRVDA